MPHRLCKIVITETRRAYGELQTHPSIVGRGFLSPELSRSKQYQPQETVEIFTTTRIDRQICMNGCDIYLHN